MCRFSLEISLSKVKKPKIAKIINSPDFLEFVILGNKSINTTPKNPPHVKIVRDLSIFSVRIFVFRAIQAIIIITKLTVVVINEDPIIVIRRS